MHFLSADGHGVKNSHPIRKGYKACMEQLAGDNGVDDNGAGGAVLAWGGGGGGGRGGGG